MLKFIILRIVWCIWCLFLDFLSSRNEGFICGTFVTFSMRLCLVLRRREHSFSLIHRSQIVNITWILFPRRLNHVCSIVFFFNGQFWVGLLWNIANYFMRGFLSWIYWINLLRMLFQTCESCDYVYTIYGLGCCSLHFNDVFLQEKPLIAVGSFC